MKILKEKLEVTDFELNNEILKSSSNFTVFNHKESEIYPKSQKNIIGFGIRFTTTIRNKKDNKIILKYKSEWFCEMHLDSILTDIINIQLYVKKGFMKHDEYFIQNKPNQLSIDTLDNNPPIDSYAESIFSHLKDNGLYEL
jgi:hypothetical protein